MRELAYPSKPAAGDRVAVLSPSAGLPEVFPAVFDLGLRRLREDLGLVPVEYPTTRRMGTTPRERAEDLHAAFADPDIKAVLTSIGGEDQIKVLPHLDPELIRANPKPFFGYSDNTNLLNYLWNLGVVSYHGAAVMVQLGRGGRMHPATEASLRAALFTHGAYELPAPTDFTDAERSWAEPTWLGSEPEMTPSEPWEWLGGSHAVTGRSWGGNLEIIDFNLRASRWLQPPAAYAGAVLLLETSEELPSPDLVYRILMGMGERGMLEQFAAVLVARPKAWSFEQPTGPDERAVYVDAQRAAVLRALAEYNPSAPVVLGIDFGHCDPQLVLPIGGEITLDPSTRRITVTY